MFSPVFFPSSLYYVVNRLHYKVLKKFYSCFFKLNVIFNCPLSSISQSQIAVSPFSTFDSSTIVLGIVVIRDLCEVPIFVSYFIFIQSFIRFIQYLYCYFCIYICSDLSKYICIDTFIYYFIHSTIVSTFVLTSEGNTIFKLCPRFPPIWREQEKKREPRCNEWLNMDI